MPQETNVQMHKAFKCLILTDLSAELPPWIRAQMTLQGESSTYKSYVLGKTLWKHKNRPPTPESLHAHPHTILYSQETDTLKPTCEEVAVHLLFETPAQLRPAQVCTQGTAFPPRQTTALTPGTC